MPENSILIADDESLVRNMLARSIQSEAGQIFLACNGREAVEIARSHPIDLAILDIVMPDMGGVEALRQIKEIDETTEVLMITGNAQHEPLRQILFEHGAYDYLLKPFDSFEIKLAVRRALRNRELVLKGNLIKDDMACRILELEKHYKERTLNLRQSQIQYRNMVEGSANMIVITQGDQVRFANTVSLEMTGYSRDEIMDMGLIDFVHPDDRQLVMNGDGGRSLGEGVPDARTFRLVKKDGSLIWVEDRMTRTLWGEAPAAMHTIQDISERMKAEEGLRIRDAALASSGSGIALADLRGNITYANRAFLGMWGYSNPNELIGKSIRRLFHSQIKGAKAVEALRTKGGYVDEATAVRKDGSTFHAQVSASMVLDESNKPICMMGSFLDLTRQKRGEELMMRAEKLSSLGQLSAGLAHELRNPLAVVSSCSQFCLENFELEPLLRENFEVIYRNAQRASKLISDLLAFARPDQLEEQEVDVNEVLTSVLQMTRLEVDPGRVTFVPRLKTGLPKVTGDKEKLSQVFLNLIQNAIHAVSGRGTIILETRFLESDNMLEVNVIDDGNGIPEEHVKKVFDPFFTTKDGGTGLGLSICHSIVEKHLGAIGVERVEKGGARVWVRLRAIGYREDNDAG
jgi:PAS domain S-box-containing protein